MAMETKDEAVEVTEKKKAPRSRIAEAERKRKGAAAPGTPRPRSRAGQPHADPAPTRRPRRPRDAETGTREPLAPTDPVGRLVVESEGESQPAGGVDTDAVAAESSTVAVAPLEADMESPTTGVAGELESAEVLATESVETDDGTDAAVAVDREALLAPEPVHKMAFAVKPQLLKAGLAPVVAALPGKTILPVLNCILISTEGDGLIRMTATDLDTTVTRTLAASVSTPGAVLVPGKKLNEIAREIPDSCTLDVRLQDDTVHLWCEETRTRYKLATIPVEDFPSPPAIPWETDSFSVPGSTLKLLVERTSFAASTEETRPILNGVLWELAPGSMAMVATNGHRLSVTRVDTAGVSIAPETELKEGTVVFEEGGEDTPAPDVIIHPRALALVSRLPQDEEDVVVSRTQTYVGFRGAGWEIITRTIPGPYPNYRAVIPQDSDRTMIADRGALAAAVRRMAIVASDQTHRIRFILGGPMMRVAVETPNLGTAHEDVPVDYEGDPLEIGFNAHYLLELLRFLPAGEVRMCFKGAERAALLCPALEEDGISTEMLLMPLRLLS
jgi:DNA polymerase-3 subunit beta